MEKNKENKAEQKAAENDNRVETPQPPQRKNPMNDSEASRDGDEGPSNKAKPADRNPESQPKKEQEPPTTTTNRRSY